MWVIVMAVCVNLIFPYKHLVPLSNLDFTHLLNGAFVNPVYIASSGGEIVSMSINMTDQLVWPILAFFGLSS